jgi:hypothetical protein
METSENNENRATSNDAAIPLLGLYPKEMKSVCGRDIFTSMFTTALFTITNKWKQMSIT